MSYKFLGVGEKIEDLDNFDPERMASRIIGMGDIVSLVEKAQDTIEEKELQKMEKKLKKGKFDFNDLLSQLRNMKKMGGISSILKFLPGASNITEQLNNSNFDENNFVKQESLILSMTKKERSNPDILNSSRKKKNSNWCW